MSDAVAISHPEKVLFPDDGITKGELCAYYEAIAPLMLPHITGRPVTMERFPAGIGKKGFIHKDVSKGFPAWLERVAVEKRDEKDRGTVHYALANDTRSLVWMANQNSVTPHVWCSRVPNLQQPDLCVFDLDPPGDEPKPLRAAALAVRDLLDELGLPSFVKTSGSKGFHIVIPLDGDDATIRGVWRFTHGAGAVLVKRHPELLTQEFIKADRAGRIFVDTGRNGPGATFAAVYAVQAQARRARLGALHLGRGRERGGRPAHLHAANDARPHRRGRRSRGRASRGGAARCATRSQTLEGLLTDDDWKESMAATTRRPTSRKATRSGRAPRRSAGVDDDDVRLHLAVDAPRPKRRAIASVATSVASPRREASRASISFRSGVPWQNATAGTRGDVRPAARLDGGDRGRGRESAGGEIARDRRPVVVAVGRPGHEARADRRGTAARALSSRHRRTRSPRCDPRR